MKLDRLMGILTILLQRERVTAPQLAGRFEVSRRTITRDIDALCRAGIPIVTMQGGGGGISIAEGYKLDKSVLTYDELQNIVVSLKGLGSITGSSEIEKTLDKLAGAREGAVFSLRDSIIIDFSLNPSAHVREKVEQLKSAIRERRLIEFTYYYEKGDSQRLIEPHHILFIWSDWYVFGYCRKRQDFRLFKFSRLWDLKILDEVFSPREIPPDAMDWEKRFADDKPLVALFDPTEKYRLIESYGPNCYTVEPDGRLLLRTGYTHATGTLTWLLSLGDKVQVLEPAGFAHEIRRQAQNIVKVYGS